MSALHFRPLLLVLLIASLSTASELTADQLQPHEDAVLFVTSMGELTIPLAMISSISLVPEETVKEGKYWFPNPNYTRLYFAPTGWMLRKGEGYFADYYFFFPMVVYGLTDRFTIGGGCSLFPGISPDKQLWYVTPKYGLYIDDRISTAIGSMIIMLPSWGDDGDDPSLVGILYGVGTVGQPDASLSFGLGYGFVEDELADHPLVMLGGEKRMSRRTAFVTENWWMPGVDSPIVSYGVRFFGEMLSVDFAFLNSFEELIFPGIPYLDFVVNF